MEFPRNTCQSLSVVHVGAGIHVNKIVTLKRKASRGSRILEQIHYVTLRRVKPQKTITGVTPAMKTWEIKEGKSVASAQCLIFSWFNSCMMSVPHTA